MPHVRKSTEISDCEEYFEEDQDINSTNYNDDGELHDISLVDDERSPESNPLSPADYIISRINSNLFTLEEKEKIKNDLNNLPTVPEEQPGTDFRNGMTFFHNARFTAIFANVTASAFSRSFLPPVFSWGGISFLIDLGHEAYRYARGEEVNQEKVKNGLSWTVTNGVTIGVTLGGVASAPIIGAALLGANLLYDVYRIARAWRDELDAHDALTEKITEIKDQLEKDQLEKDQSKYTDLKDGDDSQHQQFKQNAGAIELINKLLEKRKQERSEINKSYGIVMGAFSLVAAGFVALTVGVLVCTPPGWAMLGIGLVGLAGVVGLSAWKAYNMKKQRDLVALAAGQKTETVPENSLSSTSQVVSQLDLQKNDTPAPSSSSSPSPPPSPLSRIALLPGGTFVSNLLGVRGVRKVADSEEIIKSIPFSDPQQLP